MTSPFPQLTDPAQAGAPLRVNAAFDALSHQAVYAFAELTSSGLVWGYYGGRWGGFSVAAGTLTLTNTSANYIVVAIATGVISTSTATTNWNNSTSYVRIYKVTCAAGIVSAIEDHRAGPRGAAGSSTTTRGVLALTDGATISVDASANDQFRVTLGGNRTLANPTGMVDGQTLLFRIKQDGTGSRTLAYGGKYKFPGGTATLSTPAATIDLISCQYDVTDDTLFCTLNKAFA